MATNSEVIAFIELVGPVAVAEANRRILEGKTFVLPSVCIAQAAHETGWGTSTRMIASNALFGIKAGGSWTGKVFRADTWEMADGESYNTSANFRAYDSIAESVADYFSLICDSARYAAAVSTFPDDIKSAYDTLYAIWAGGYATDEEYVPNVWGLLEGRDLTQWDEKVDGITTTPSTGGGYVPPVDTSTPQYIFSKI